LQLRRTDTAGGTQQHQAVAVPAGAADELTMRVTAAALGADRTLGCTSPCVDDGWTSVVCNPSGRVSAIRVSLTGEAPLCFLAGCVLLLLAASVVPAGATGLLLASREEAMQAQRGCLLAESVGPARATGVLLASRGAAARAHRPLGGCLLDASAVPARAAGQLVASGGAATQLAGCLLAATAVLARAAGQVLASRGSETRRHRALSFVLLFTACVVPAHAAGIYVNRYQDDITMHAIATALGADRALGWSNNTSPCVDGWIGVVCNNQWRVSAIYARNASLNGTLAQDIIFLSSLGELDLRDNSITGDVPDAVFLDMTRLRLDGNHFSSVPASFLGAARSLQLFSISNNSQLRSWELTSGHLRFDNTLQVYMADHAHLSGTLSSFLGNANSFNRLRFLSMSNNQLTGEVPATFGSRTLTYLDLSGNFLTGPIDFIANLPELEVLLLDRNGFTGPLPDFSGHWSLTLVNLGHNRLTGVVPASLVRLEGLSSV
jgi:hypothetical protein